jgi:hypothetical protein
MGEAQGPMGRMKCTFYVPRLVLVIDLSANTASILRASTV